MPGYPLVLITTDLLQEGEDLHTFCSSVHHYGISWAPSAMEQRIGRIDRVRSQADRRLSSLEGPLQGPHKLQVHFPHLRDTVEVLQVRRVLDRMDVFLRLMHDGLGTPAKDDPRINVIREFDRQYRVLRQTESIPLKSSFPVRPEHLRTQGTDNRAGEIDADAALRRFQALRLVDVPGIPMEWEDHTPLGLLIGTAKLSTRIQPLSLQLHVMGRGVRIHCVSPIGKVRPDARQDEVIASAWRLGVRIGALLDYLHASYDLTVEEDVLLTDRQEHDADRFRSLMRRVVEQADRLEQEFLPGSDQPLSVFRRELEEEASNDR
jgi:hypothetical protein